MTDRKHYTARPASVAQVRKDGENWTLTLLRELRHSPETKPDYGSAESARTLAFLARARTLSFRCRCTRDARGSLDQSLDPMRALVLAKAVSVLTSFETLNKAVSMSLRFVERLPRRADRSVCGLNLRVAPCSQVPATAVLSGFKWRESLGVSQAATAQSVVGTADFGATTIQAR
jgi:hypothetical protein